MAHRIGSAVDSADMLEQLKSFLTTSNEYREISVSGSGNGTISVYSAIDDAPTEDWVLTCTAGGTSATFSVEGSITGTTADATANTAYANGVVAFTITNGSTDWAVDDTITFTLVRNMGTTSKYEVQDTKYAPYKVIRTDTDDVYEPTEFGAVDICEGKYGPNTGLRLRKGALQCKANGYLGDFLVSEEVWDQLPITWTISFWMRGALSDYYTIFNHPISSYYEKYRYSGTIHPSKFNASKREFGVSASLDKFLIYNVQTTSYLEFITILEGNHLGENIARSNVWNLYTVSSDGTTIRMSINGGTIVTTPDDGTNKPLLQYIGVPFLRHYYRNEYTHHASSLSDICDVCVWGNVLDSTEITDLYNSTTAVASGDTRLIYKVNIVSPIISSMKITNDSSIGNTVNYDIGYEHTDDLATVGLRGTVNTLPEVNYLPSNAKVTTELFAVDTIKNGYSRSSYTGLRKYGEGIEKFWFTATEDYITISYKIYDVNDSVQKLPVYQTMYLGLLNNNGISNNYLVTFGTSNSLVSWTSTSTDFTSGVLSNVSGSIFRGTTDWGSYEVDFSDMPEDVVNVPGSTTIFPINYYTTTEEYYAQHSYQLIGYLQPMQLGNPAGIYVVPGAGIQSEDIVTVSGTNYIVLQDTWQESKRAWLAIALT